MLNKVIVFSFLLVLIKTEELKSRLNKLELENFKYDIKIDNKLMSNEDIHKSMQNRLSIKSSNGQTYSCQLPDYAEGDELHEHLVLAGDVSGDDTAATKSLSGNFGNDDDDDDDLQSEFSLLSLFYETSSSVFNSKKYPKPQINFTLVNEKVKAYMARLNESNLCLYKNLGWWTYEFCFGKYASQYHLLNNGSIDGEKINLGNFSHDYDWLKANMTNYPTSSGILYHEQYFDSGSHCELSGRPRRSIVKIFCDELGSNHIDLISEIETCVYEIHVNSFLVCSVPQFRKAPQNFQINCNPVVNNHIYGKYMQKKSAAAQEAAASAAALTAESTTEAATTAGAVVSTSNEIAIEVIAAAATNAEAAITSIYDDPKLLELLENEIMDELQNSGLIDDNEMDVDVDSISSLAVPTSRVHDVSDDDDDDDHVDIRHNREEKQRLQQIKNELNKGKEALKDLKADAREYENAIDNLKKQKHGETDTSKAKDNVLDTLKSIKSKHENMNKILENLGDQINEMVSSEPSIAKKASTQASKNDLNQDDQTSQSAVESAQDEKLASLERTLEEKLAKSAKLSQKLKNAGGEIKVKIITLDPNSDTLKGLDDEESKSLSELLTSLLVGQSDKLRELKSNYDSLYTEDSIESLVHAQEKENEMAAKEKKRLSSQLDYSNSFFFGLLGDFDDTSSDDSDNNDNNEKLIIY